MSIMKNLYFGTIEDNEINDGVVVDKEDLMNDAVVAALDLDPKDVELAIRILNDTMCREAVFGPDGKFLFQTGELV